jgi:hypothetical protein
MSEVRKVFITVKIYPTLSKSYDELVCTAGILDDGSWVRVYPLPFRKLDYENRYQKYQWMELPIERNFSDPRPESFKVTDLSKVKLIDKPIGTDQGWLKRKEIIFAKNEIYTNLDKLINLANNNQLSLAIFKPTKLIDFIVEETERDWNSEHLEILKQKANQLSLFQTIEEVTKEFSVVKKLPYKFSYKFCDDSGKESTLMIEDWEIGALYWNCLKKNNSEQSAIKLVQNKYWDIFLKKDLHLFLGTTRQFHGWAKNPFVITGVFYPPIINQQDLF